MRDFIKNVMEKIKHLPQLYYLSRWSDLIGRICGENCIWSDVNITSQTEKNRQISFQTTIGN